jgi:hypothetical protein
MKCILEKLPLKHKSIRLVPRNSRGTELLERMRRQNKKWGWVGETFCVPESAKTDWRDRRNLNCGRQTKDSKASKANRITQRRRLRRRTGQDASSRMYCDFEDRRTIGREMHACSEGGQRQVRDAPQLGRAAAALYRRHKSGDAVYAQCRERSSPDVRLAPRNGAHD